MDGKIENILLVFNPKKATEMRKSSSSSYGLCCAKRVGGVAVYVCECVCVCAMGSAEHTAQITSMEISLECSSVGFA